MQIENSTTINGRVVHKVESNKGVVVYQDDSDVMYVCHNGAVVYTLEVDPHFGEGGGGSIAIKKHK